MHGGDVCLAALNSQFVGFPNGITCFCGELLEWGHSVIYYDIARITYLVGMSIISRVLSRLDNSFFPIPGAMSAFAPSLSERPAAQHPPTPRCGKRDKHSVFRPRLQ